MEPEDFLSAVEVSEYKEVDHPGFIKDYMVEAADEDAFARAYVSSNAYGKPWLEDERN